MLTFGIHWCSPTFAKLETGSKSRRLLMASVHGLQQLGGVRLELQVLAVWQTSSGRASVNQRWLVNIRTSEHFPWWNPWEVWKVYGISWGKSIFELFMRSKWRGFANLHVWLQAKKLWQNACWFMSLQEGHPEWGVADTIHSHCRSYWKAEQIESLW